MMAARDLNPTVNWLWPAVLAVIVFSIIGVLRIEPERAVWWCSCLVSRERGTGPWSRFRLWITGNQASPEAESGNVPLRDLTAEGRSAAEHVQAQPASDPGITTPEIRAANGASTEANGLASPELGSRALTGRTAEGTRTSRPQAPDDPRSGEVLRPVSEQDITEASSSGRPRHWSLTLKNGKRGCKGLG
ncbi:hypothetical protein PG987_001065 [Apiospora arundinis]